MSYILEALKKSEQERGNESSPSIQTIHSSSLQYTTQQNKPLWPYALAIVFTLNIAALIYFLAPGNNDTESAINATQAQPGIPVVAIQSARQEPAPATQAAPAQIIASAPPPTFEPEPATRPAKPFQQENYTPPQAEPAYKKQAPVVQYKDEDIIDIFDLPVDIQTSIPDMVFSAHVYSSNPAQRSVVINGNFMEEGGMLTSSLQLDEITPGGVVFNYKGTRFRSSVLSNWSVN